MPESGMNRVQPTYQLQPLDLVAPGFHGINSVQAGSLLDPSYCIQATNAIIDTSGRLAARSGIVTQTTTPIVLAQSFTGAPATGALSATLTAAWTRTTGPYTFVTSTGQTIVGSFIQGNTAVTFNTAITGSPTANITVSLPIVYSFEYVKGGPTYTELVTWAGGISANLSSPLANNIAGTVNVTNGQWFFGNFNNKVIGFQSGQGPIVWNGTGNFASIVASQGSVVTGGVGCTAFGRVWQVASDGQTIHYSGLLDETDWGSASSGIIDMHTIWSAGTDTVTAIVAFNAALVVFGTNHIVFFTDGRGSMLGLDPTQAYVFDVIGSTGAYSQWTVQQIGEGDIVFLGPNGLQSLGNLQNARSFPMSNLSKYVRDNLLQQVSQETQATIRSTYNNFLGQYFLSLPNSGTIWCLDIRRIYKDEVGDECGIMTNWTMNGTAMHSTQNNLTYIARTPGTIGLYSGNSDEGTTYQFSYLSGWLNLGEQVAQKLKMLKRFESILFSGGSNTVTYNWNTDFGNNVNTATLNIAATGVPSLYGLGQYGLSQYGGGSSLTLLKYDARARGQYYQIGINAIVSNLFSIQQIQLAVKIGRTA
jgi:hypothetical protein